MDLSIDRVIDPSAIVNGIAFVLGLLAQLTAILPKGLDERLGILRDTCFTRRVRVFRDFLAAYMAMGALPLGADGSAQTHELVETYVRDADRHGDNRMQILRLLRYEQCTGLLVGAGWGIALFGIVVALLWKGGQSWMLGMGLIGLVAEAVALMTAYYVQHRCKGLEQAAEFQGGNAG